MTHLALEDIQNNFAEVVVNLQPGEVVQIISGDQVIARLTGEREPVRKTRQPGSALGTIRIIADDDDLKDFSDYMP